MTYRVRIKSLVTGDEQWSESHEYAEDTAEWWWTEGNMGCDCNLEGYFEKEAQTEECGTKRYMPLFIEKDDGTLIKLMQSI